MTTKMITPEDAADRLGVSIRQVQVLCEEGMPHEGLGNRRFVLWPEARHWRDKRIEAKTKKSLRAGGAEESKDRKLAAEAEMAEMELAQRRGEVMPVEDGEREIGEAFARVRSKLLNLPNAIAMRVTSETLPGRKEQAQMLVDEVMAELAAGEDVPE
jgi:hypothetical protein